MDKIQASVFIITKNEEKHIEHVLNSCSDFDEVIVVDSGSTDKTLDIARSKGAKTFFNEWEGYAKQKQYSVGLCKNEWVLNLDADEVLTSELIEEIKRVVVDNDADGLICRRKDMFMGGFFSSLTRLPSNLRFFKKSRVQYHLDKMVHEGPSVSGQIKKTNKYFLHHGYNSVHDYMKKQNLYSTLRAKESAKKSRLKLCLKLFLAFPTEFLRKYILHRYCFSGTKGFVYSMIAAQYSFLKAAKMLEKTGK